MGANEKHAASYHGREYTPTTAIVHSIYMTAWNSTADPVDQQEVQDKARDEFTRWLETVRAEAKAEALREAAAQYPVMLRNMVSRGSVAVWLRARANQYKSESLSCEKQG